MALKIPIVLYNGILSQLQAGDTIASPDQTTVTNGDAGALIAGQVVVSQAAGAVQKCNATALATSRVLGLMTGPVGISGTGTMQDDGLLTLTTGQWDAVAGTTGGLTAGAPYWADPANNGKLTGTPPTTATQFLVQLGVALSATVLDLDIQAPIGL